MLARLSLLQTQFRVAATSPVDQQYDFSTALIYVGNDFFDLSHRLESPDGSFNGVIAVAVKPKYFEDFYTLIGKAPGTFWPGPYVDEKKRALWAHQVTLFFFRVCS